MTQEMTTMVEQIKLDHKKNFELTAREFIRHFGYYRRTSGNCYYIDKYLEDNELVVEPKYDEVWIGSEVVLKHKPVAYTKCQKDPVVKIKVIEAANKAPVYVKNDDTLQKAITLMRLHDYSQLPVSTGNLRNVCGYISWESIVNAQIRGVSSDLVKDYKATDVHKLSEETPILDAIEDVFKYEFVLVENNSHEVTGIITTTDISQQFLINSQSYILLSEIEIQIRQLLNDKFLLEEIKKVCQESGRTVSSIDDLTFGEYIFLMQKDENWLKLNCNVDKATFLAELDAVRQIRNDVMHFEPEGITDEQHARLLSVARLLKTLR